LGREQVTTRAIVTSGVVIVLMTPVWTEQDRRRHDVSMRSGDDAEEVTMLDSIDREIIGELERDGRISWQELGRRVRLSPNATGDRVRRLERRGIITGYRALVDPAALGRSLEALISVRLAPNSDAGQLEARLAAWPEVEEAVHVTGRFDFELKVSTSGPRGLDDLLVDMKRELGVAETETRLVLRRIVPGPGR
jgi:Lrp/AsnC family leucine-responsive transcriptional regulator